MNETTVTTEAVVGIVEALAAANRRMVMAVTERTANRNLSHRPPTNDPALARNKVHHSPPDNLRRMYCHHLPRIPLRRPWPNRQR